jgi:hypothetical protein
MLERGRAQPVSSLFQGEIYFLGYLEVFYISILYNTLYK